MFRSMEKENGEKENIFTFILLSTNRHPSVVSSKVGYLCWPGVFVKNYPRDPALSTTFRPTPSQGTGAVQHCRCVRAGTAGAAAAPALTAVNCCFRGMLCKSAGTRDQSFEGLLEHLSMQIFTIAKAILSCDSAHMEIPETKEELESLPQVTVLGSGRVVCLTLQE